MTTTQWMMIMFVVVPKFSLDSVHLVDKFIQLHFDRLCLIPPSSSTQIVPSIEQSNIIFQLIGNVKLGGTRIILINDVWIIECTQWLERTISVVQLNWIVWLLLLLLLVSLRSTVRMKQTCEKYIGSIMSI